MEAQSACVHRIFSPLALMVHSLPPLLKQKLEQKKLRPKSPEDIWWKESHRTAQNSAIDRYPLALARSTAGGTQRHWECRYRSWVQIVSKLYHIVIN